jgi:hypothetical protein
VQPSGDETNPSLADKVAEKAEEVSKGTVDVSAKYTLPVGTEELPPVGGGATKIDVPKNYLSGSTPVINYTAEKNLDTKVVTIKLSGTVTDTFVGSDSVVDLWYGGMKDDAKKIGGNYAIVTIDGILAEKGALAKDRVIKNTNPSWVYYKGWTTLDSPPTGATTETYIDLNDYDKSVHVGKRATEQKDSDLTLLLWSGPQGGTIRIKRAATLDITPAGDGAVDPYRVIIDWADLTIQASPAETLAAALGEGNATVSGSIVTLAKNTTLAADKSVTVPKDVTLVVPSSGGGATKLTITGTLTNNGAITLVGTIDKGSPGTYSGSGEFFVSTVAALNSAVKFNIPTISLNPAFYTAATSGAGAIVIGADATRRTVPVTIKGTGSANTLDVGVLIANDNITLDGVKFNITVSTRGKPSIWGLTSYSYYSAVFIGRSANGTALLSDEHLACHNVTVKNTNITFKGNAGFTAGIYVTAAGLYPPKNLNIKDNNVSVEGSGGNAAQALAIIRHDPTMVVTGNTLTSSNTATGSGAWNAPASALYINIQPGITDSTGLGDFSGNTLNGIFDFYIVGRSRGNYVGDPTLFAQKFGTKDTDTAWTTNSTGKGFYRNLVKTLISQSKASGFGLVYECLGTSDTLNSGSTNGTRAYEAYEITNNAVTAIDYWSPGISGDAYATTAMTTTTGGTRGRLGRDGSEWDSGTFHWTRDVPEEE